MGDFIFWIKFGLSPKCGLSERLIHKVKSPNVAGLVSISQVVSERGQVYTDKQSHRCQCKAQAPEIEATQLKIKAEYCIHG